MPLQFTLLTLKLIRYHLQFQSNTLALATRPQLGTVIYTALKWTSFLLRAFESLTSGSTKTLFKRLEIKEFYFRQLVCYNHGKNGQFVQF